MIVLLHHPVAGVFAAAIDAQNTHCRECSRKTALRHSLSALREKGMRALDYRRAGGYFANACPNAALSPSPPTSASGPLRGHHDGVVLNIYPETASGGHLARGEFL